MKKDIHFKNLLDRVEKFRGYYMMTLASFTIFDEISKVLAINIVGKRKAEKNLEIINRYNYFFSITKESNRSYFLIELSKLFDKNNQSLGIESLIEYAEKNITSLSEKHFLQYHDKREIIPELFKSYKQLNLKDLEKIKRRLHNNSSKIDKIRIYRDKFLAHNDIRGKEIIINKNDIITLLNIVKDTIDLFYNKLNFSTNSYKNFSEEPSNDIRRVVDDLIEYRKVFNKNIKEKYKL